MNKEQIQQEVASKFKEMIDEFWSNPDTKEKLEKYIESYIKEYYGDEISIREYFDKEIFKQ